MNCENPCASIFESNCGKFMNQLPSGYTENWVKGSVSVKQSLVLDAEKGEPVKAAGRLGKKIGASDVKTLAALKSHSEAERRRRDRINAHFSTLRDLLHANEKMDKASLLAEVISQMKQLRKTAAEVCGDLHIPTDSDELEVEVLDKNAADGSLLLRASLCCDYKPDLFSDIKQAINDLPIKVLKSEISTLGSRVKSVFFITADKEMNTKHIVGLVRLSLSNILEKVSASAELAQLLYPQKRQKVADIDS